MSFCVTQSVQAVFRSLASLEKTVEKCHIVLQEQKNRLTFTLHCKHGIENIALFYHHSVNDFHQDHFSFHALLCIRYISLYDTIYSILLCFVLFLIAGLLKTHNLSYQDSESLQAMFDKDSYANVFRSHARSAKYSYILIVNTRVHLKQG